MFIGIECSTKFDDFIKNRLYEFKLKRENKMFLKEGYTANPLCKVVYYMNHTTGLCDSYSTQLYTTFTQLYTTDLQCKKYTVTKPMLYFRTFGQDFCMDHGHRGSWQILYIQ